MDETIIMEFVHGIFKIKSSSRNRRGGFSHDSTLYINGVECGKTSVHYYNRTWESYQYQTSMRRLIEERIEHEKRLIKKHVFWMWKRLNDTRKEKLHKYFRGADLGGHTGQDLLDLVKAIETGKGHPDPVLKMLKVFDFMGDIVAEKETVSQRVKRKQTLVFATLRNKIPDWQEPNDWKRLNDTDKLERLEGTLARLCEDK